MLREVVPELQAENEKLWLLIQRLLRHRYGPRSEKLDLDQLQFGLEDEEQGAAEGEAAAHAACQSQSWRAAGTPAALRGRHRYREQRLSLLRRRATQDRRGSHRAARHCSQPATREGSVPPALRLPRLRGGGRASFRTGTADRWRHGDGSTG